MSLSCQPVRACLNDGWKGSKGKKGRKKPIFSPFTVRLQKIAKLFFY